MEEIDRTATNWNVVQLHVYLNPGEEKRPYGERRATMERTFDQGFYTFDEAREIVLGHLWTSSPTLADADEIARAWRAQPDALEAALGDHSWAIFQHGATARDGINVVMERMLRGLPEEVRVKLDLGHG